MTWGAAVLIGLALLAYALSDARLIPHLIGFRPRTLVAVLLALCVVIGRVAFVPAGSRWHVYRATFVTSLALGALVVVIRYLPYGKRWRAWGASVLLGGLAILSVAPAIGFLPAGSVSAPVPSASVSLRGRLSGSCQSICQLLVVEFPQGGGLSLRRAHGGLDDHLATFGSSPSYSPRTRSTAFGGTLGHPGVWITLKSKAPVRVAHAGYNPSWSPDGRRLAFEMPETAGAPVSRVAILRFDTKDMGHPLGPPRIIHTPCLQLPRWLDNSHVLVRRSCDSAPGPIWRIPLPGGRPTPYIRGKYLDFDSAGEDLVVAIHHSTLSTFKRERRVRLSVMPSGIIAIRWSKYSHGALLIPGRGANLLYWNQRTFRVLPVPAFSAAWGPRDSTS
jgi:hypothetical protein